MPIASLEKAVNGIEAPASSGSTNWIGSSASKQLSSGWLAGSLMKLALIARAHSLETFALCPIAGMT